MPKFKVLCRFDAFIDYEAEVDADDPYEAAELARQDHASFEWTRVGDQEFDASRYITLDKDGEEIAETECGDI